MPSTIETIRELTNTYHAYVFGTSFWYFLRGITRVIDPETVCDWFRPPKDGHPTANDLELYTTWTDAWCLLSLSAILLVLADAVPLPASIAGSSLSAASSTPRSKKPYAKAVVIITMLHHAATGYGAFQHWIQPSHHTIAMDIGVYGNVALIALGAAALVWGLEEDGMVLRDGKVKQ
ncbi:hypothetical protein PRZ48_002017 [Zasmidium cellare]|uniref:Uncharacterized protein n=1 Tax=Zasmidium cellare TaxID=395010 RepID=A0ABR0F2V5_ZASCE|nr:hypothetical protein PRZ48_002017 [Zasmidium cellare]